MHCLMISFFFVFTLASWALIQTSVVMDAPVIYARIFVIMFQAFKPILGTCKPMKIFKKLWSSCIIKYSVKCKLSPIESST